MSARRKPEDVDAGPGVSEAGYRFGPVFLIAVGLAPDLADVLTICTQPWAASAGDDDLLHGLKDGKT
jgi:hypothetical protein